MVGEGLTLGQRRFAEQHHASPGAAAGSDGDLLFFYVEDEFGTTRWLVGRDGAAVEQVTFRTYPTSVPDVRFDGDALLLAAA
jgi:Tol biopolymer transport system component